MRSIPRKCPIRWCRCHWSRHFRSDPSSHWPRAVVEVVEDVPVGAVEPVVDVVEVVLDALVLSAAVVEVVEEELVGAVELVVEVEEDELVGAVELVVELLDDEVVVDGGPGTADHTKPSGSDPLALNVISMFQLSVRAPVELAQATPTSHTPPLASSVASGILPATTAGPHSRFTERVWTTPVDGAVLNGP